MGKPLNNLQGFQFGSLTVLQLGESHGNGAVWLCQCKCGTQKEIRSSDMVQGKVKSCGCEHTARVSASNVTHGMSKTRTYRIWQAMRNRCNRINQDYSCRGITYDESWDEFANFLADMGEAPDNMSIDRIDPNGNYEKANCRWATQDMQANNRRSSVFIEYNAKKQTVAQWAKELNMNHYTLRSRLKKGLPLEQAFTPLPADEGAV